MRIKDGSVYLGRKRIVPEEEIEKLLRKIQDDPARAKWSVKALTQYISENYMGIGPSAIREFLGMTKTYQMYKPLKPSASRPIRKPIVAQRVNQRWQADLIIMEKPVVESVRNGEEYITTRHSLANANGGTKYILVVIDCYSKRMWVRPLKSKTGRATADAFASIFEEEHPEYLQSDNGPEFVNPEMKALLEEYNIKQIVSGSYNPRANGQVERANQTLKRAIQKFMEYHTTRRYIDNLQEIVKNYNNTYHSTIKDTPMNVYRKQPQKTYEHLQDFAMKEIERTPFDERDDIEPGDFVRLSLRSSSSNYRKEAQGRGRKITDRLWTEKIYRVRKVSYNRFGEAQYDVGESVPFLRTEVQPVEPDEIIQGTVVRNPAPNRAPPLAPRARRRPARYQE
jgi:transposase InsO family protein